MLFLSLNCCSLTIKVADKPPLVYCLGWSAATLFVCAVMFSKQQGDPLRKIKKGLTHCAIKPFRCLVAGIGFEPMTFGL